MSDTISDASHVLSKHCAQIMGLKIFKYCLYHDVSYIMVQIKPLKNKNQHIKRKTIQYSSSFWYNMSLKIWEANESGMSAKTNKIGHKQWCKILLALTMAAQYDILNLSFNLEINGLEY